MKKIFTLLFAVGLLTLAQAQPGSRKDRQVGQRDDQRDDQRDFDNGYGKTIANDHNAFYKDIRFDNRFAAERRMKIKIAEINREYSYKIQRVRNSFFLSRFDKQRQINYLEKQRRWEINKVYDHFNNRFNNYDRRDHGNKNNRRY